MERIPIDPVEELLKAIGIVHGAQAAYLWRRIVDAIQERARRGLPP